MGIGEHLDELEGNLRLLLLPDRRNLQILQDFSLLQKHLSGYLLNSEFILFLGSHMILALGL
jgi:hypothetical protein